MRTIYSILLLVFALHIFAQTPQGFNYSAVARDAAGKPLANKNMNVQISILKGNANGAVQYTETHLVNSDSYGLFNLVVGNGSVVTGTLSNLPWGADNYFLKTAIDANGGANFLTMGTTQLLSVPYALHSKKSDNGIDKVSATGDTLYLSNGKFVMIPGVSLANVFSVQGSSISINGDSYSTVKLGNGQEWFSENLRTSQYNDGTRILRPDSIEWANNFLNNSSFPMMSWYNNDSITNITNQRGALYNWFCINPTSNGNKNICPQGWHVPSESDWENLINYVGGIQLAGKNLKTISGWNQQDVGNNLVGFSAFPSGARGPQGTFFYDQSHVYYWASTESNLCYLFDSELRKIQEDKSSGFSVRCIKD